jgi:hypothetical protein
MVMAADSVSEAPRLPGPTWAPYAAPWAPATPEAGRETELEFLRQEAAAAKEALDGMEARIRELESKES